MITNFISVAYPIKQIIIIIASIFFGFVLPQLTVFVLSFLDRQAIIKIILIFLSLVILISPFNYI